MVEPLFCNQKVIGSTPIGGSNFCGNTVRRAKNNALSKNNIYMVAIVKK